MINYFLRFVANILCLLALYLVEYIFVVVYVFYPLRIHVGLVTFWYSFGIYPKVANLVLLSIFGNMKRFSLVC